MRYKLMTSNIKKLEEYKRLGLDADIGHPTEDLDEPDTTGDEVALRKALVTGAYTIVEDTSLDIENASIGANIRWNMETLNLYHGASATFTVYLARNNGTQIDVFKGEIKGHIDVTKILNKTNNSFGFDPVFVPDGSTLSLDELNSLGLKDQYSARKLVCDNLIANNILKSEKIENITPWNGPWQGP